MQGVSKVFSNSEEMFLFHIKFLLSYWAFHVISYFKKRNFHYCYICHKPIHWRHGVIPVGLRQHPGWPLLDGLLEIKFNLFIYQPLNKSIHLSLYPFTNKEFIYIRRGIKIAVIKNLYYLHT